MSGWTSLKYNPLVAMRLLFQRVWLLAMLSFDLAALEAQPFDLLLMDLNYTRDTVSEGEGLDLLAKWSFN
jgi:hypothetical protein